MSSDELFDIGHTSEEAAHKQDTGSRPLISNDRIPTLIQGGNASTKREIQF